MKKIFLFIMIIFFVPNVFASNTNVSSKVKYSTDSAKGTYKGDEIYLGGYNGLFSINHRYNGRLAMVSFYINVNDYNFTTNHTYTITLNMATEDWRNHFMGPQVFEANSSGTLGSSLNANNFRFVSMKQIKFNFRTDGSLPTYIFFRVYSTDYASPTGNTAITGVNNWNLSSIYINNNVSATPTPAPVTPAPTPTPQPSNKDIIDNATKNTQDIINNQNSNTESLIENSNQNTTDIIENNNQNTQNIIDNQTALFTNKCTNLFNKKDYVDLININSSGTYIEVTGSYTNNGINYISVKSGKTYTISSNVNRQWVYNFSTKVPEYNESGSTRVVTSGYSVTFTVPTGYSYFNVRSLPQNNEDNFNQNIMLVEGSTISANWCEFGSSTSNKIDDNTKAINDLNDTMKDSNIDNGTGSDFFDSFNNDMHGLSSIITIPLNSINSLTSSQCSPLHFPIPFTNKSLDLPCMTEIYEQHVPTLLTLIQTCWYGLLSYKVLVNIFGIVKGFKDPDSDKIEVMEL